MYGLWAVLRLEFGPCMRLAACNKLAGSLGACGVGNGLSRQILTAGGLREAHTGQHNHSTAGAPGPPHSVALPNLGNALNCGILPAESAIVMAKIHVCLFVKEAMNGSRGRRLASSCWRRQCPQRIAGSRIAEPRFLTACNGSRVCHWLLTVQRGTKLDPAVVLGIRYLLSYAALHHYAIQPKGTFDQ